MTEDELQRERQVAQEKDVAFYTASVEAWLNTSLEYDKSIFALSGGGIGLLTTLLTTIGAPSIMILCFYALAVICLAASLILILIIFKRNKKHLEDVVFASEAIEDEVLKRLDLAVLWVFGMGAILTLAVGFLSAVDSYEAKSKETKGKIMANEKRVVPSGMSETNASVNGISTFTRSFNGLANMRPPTNGSTQTSSPAPAAQPSTSTTPTASANNGNGSR